jgi:hypothetical protein
VRHFSKGELVAYAFVSPIYWGFFYYLIQISPIFVCGLGPDSPDDCSGQWLAILIGLASLALYILLCWQIARDANRGDNS